MPDHLWVPARVREFVLALGDDQLRAEISATTFGLLFDPVPPDVRVFQAGGEDLEGHYELDIDGVLTVLYVVDGEHVMVQLLVWREL